MALIRVSWPVRSRIQKIQLSSLFKTILATNAILRRIDLLSDVFGPIVTGIIMSFVSRWFSALFIALWNAISLVIELYLYTQVYRLAEEKLSKKNIGMSDIMF